ncbi:MAG: PorV/PorQ family protein [Bacteroidales bacterium]|nr:PorV/PorQ family protein [Candidatus Cryptobacteroides faecihippi]
MKKISIRVLTLVAGVIVSAAAAYAQSSEAMPSLRINHDGAAAGMGFAGVASSSRIAYSSFRNSAMIPFSEEKVGAGVSFQGWAPNGEKMTNIALGSAFRIGENLGLSVGGAYLGGEPYDVYDATGTMKGTDKSSDMVFNAGIGYRIVDFLSVGVNARYASESLSASDSYSAFGADVFVAAHFSDLSVAAGVSSIGSSVTSASGASFSLPTSATLGIDYSKTFAEVHGIEVAPEADYFFSGNLTAALGAQYSFNDMVFVRGGYHFGTEGAALPSFMTVGLGAKFVGINIDFAYLTGNELIGNTLTVGLGYSF